MAFNYMENISYNNNRPNFERDSVKTIAQLLAINPADKGYDYGHIVFCEEDGRHYKFNYDYDNPPANDEKDAVTGWFVPSDGTRKAVRNSEGSVLSKGYIILNRNRDFVSQINVDETIYEIRDYFDLGGEEITLPTNCVLKFSGGMLANGTVIGNGITIEAPLFRIFADDITLKGDFNCDFYPEWFGAVTYSEATAIDNTAVFNNAITQIYNMSGAHDLILTGTYLIKDTIFLKPKASLIGRYAKTSYDTVIGNKEIGSGFLVDFDDNNKYAIDSCLTQLTADNNNIGKKLALIKYNHLWFNAGAALEDSYIITDNIVYDNGSSQVDDTITGKLWTNGWRKSINIKNIILQPLNKPTQSSEIPFGGIRLYSWFSGTIDSVTIQGFAVCLNIANSWSCSINRLNILTHYIGVYYGAFCTQCDIRNSDIERYNANGVYFDHKTAELVYREKDKLLLPYDDSGRVEGDEGFTYPITKYIATPESVDDDFLTNYVGTQLLTVAIMTESYDIDQTKVLLDNIVFQAIDGIFINTNICNASFNFCYIEGITKLGFYTYKGAIRWLNPSFIGNMINPYGAVTFEGKITIEDMNSPRCYPSYTMEDVKNGLTRPRYYVTPQELYYDKFIVIPSYDNTRPAGSTPSQGTVKPGSVAAAKQLVPINNTYYIGIDNWNEKYNWNDYTDLNSGLERNSWIPFKRVLELYDPKVATFYLAFSSDDYSAEGILLKDKDFTFIRYKNTDTNGMFNSTTPMRLQDSNVKFVNISITCLDTIKNVFEVAGKCSIWADTSSNIAPGAKLIKLISEDNRPVELDFFYNRAMNSSDVHRLYLSNLDEYGIKYTLKITTLTDTEVYTNTTPPTKGIAKGETFIYDGITLVWNGSSWDTQLIPNYDLYVALGAECNNTGADITKTAPWGEEVVHKSGHWYYNGIGDLTDVDMLNIYLHKDLVTTRLNLYMGVSRINTIRTIVPIEYGRTLSNIPVDSRHFFRSNPNVQVLRWGLLAENYGQNLITLDTTDTNCMLKMGANMTLAFAECYALKYIYPINVSDTTDFSRIFAGSGNIIDARLYGLKANIDLSPCPNIRKECLMYIITNANPTTAITITLHATAYANLAEDADIVTKLEEKNTALYANGGSISLVSA